jgi:hypothetical protein
MNWLFSWFIGRGRILPKHISGHFFIIVIEDETATHEVIVGYTTGHSALFRLWDACADLEVTDVSASGDAVTFIPGISRNTA